MNIFQIDSEIEAILADLPINDETGEIIDDELFARLNALTAERDHKIENLVLFCKNKAALAEALKAEKLMIAKRQKSAESAVESCRRYIEAVLGGEKFVTAQCEVAWRRTQKCEITDQGECVEFLTANSEYSNCYKTKIDINRAEVTKLIKAGVDVAGAELVPSLSMSIK